MVSLPQQERRPKKPHKRVHGGSGVSGVDLTKAAQLVIDCKYSNELPRPPVPKLLRALPTSERLCQYMPTSLELDHRPFLLSERGLFSRLNLLDPGAYGEAPTPGSMPPPPPPQDAQLLRDEDVDAAAKEAERKRRRLTEHTDAWHRQAFGLQAPQLVTNDVFTERQRFTTGTEAAEKKLHRDPPGFSSVEDLASRIEKTFEDARAPPTHPSKPSLKPKRILSIVPDAVLWANRYRQVVFDELPHEPARYDLLFKSTPTPRATCFGYFSPAEDEGDAGAYKLEQNYYWMNRGGFTRSNDRGEGEAMLLSFPLADEPSGEVRFIPVPTAIKLKKQNAYRLDLGLETQSLSVKHRDPSAQEAAEEQERMNVVLNDDAEPDQSEASLDYIQGEWQIRGDPRSAQESKSETRSHAETRSLGETSREPTTPHAPPLPPSADPSGA
uniref:RNA polymerase II-associated factor 1 homolog n=1 Tax=Alexandrium monilatum TaxID=311494 RepID=A0A7S4W4V9_9DINO